MLAASTDPCSKLVAVELSNLYRDAVPHSFATAPQKTKYDTKKEQTVYAGLLFFSGKFGYCWPELPRFRIALVIQVRS